MKRIGMDVSVLAQEKRTGIGNYCFNLIDHLLRLNKTDKFILFAITPLNSSNEDINYFRKYSNVEIKIIRLPIQIFRRIFLLWQKVNWPPIEYFIGKVDILHSFNTFLPPQKSGKTVATFYDLTAVLFPKWHKTETTQMDDFRFQRMTNKADLITTISENSKKDFLEKYGKRRIEVVYPGISIGDSGNKRNWEDRGEYILFVGTVEPRKNLEGLIKAYAKFLEVAPDLATSTLIIIGSKGWMVDEIYNLPKKLGIEERVKFLDFVNNEELFNLYKNALCLVYPSFYEGFGIPVLEAMSLGVPVICSNTSSLPEVGGLSAGGAVLYVDPQNPDEIAKAIQKIFKNEKIRKSLIHKGLVQARKFSWKMSAEKLLKSYDSLPD